MQLAGGFAILAVALCVFGIYGVVSYAVSEREQEIGVRLALGASARQILAAFIGTGVKPALLGIVLGTAAAAALTRFLQPVLFDTRPTDVATFASVVVLLLGLTMGAAWLPASRATAVDPSRSLRGR
jgi:putative ABC transport system permease protein